MGGCIRQVAACIKWLWFMGCWRLYNRLGWHLGCTREVAALLMWFLYYTCMYSDEVPTSMI